MSNTTIMGAIEEVYEELDADVSEEEFREAVEAKVEQMGGLADDETAAMLVAHELDDADVEGIADVEPGMEDVVFTGKVTDVGELREFKRDDGSEGRVLNAELADETGAIRVTFWDGMAVEADERLEPGDVINVGGRPDEGYSGVEVNVDDVEAADAEVDIQVGDTHAIEALSLGLSSVNVRGRVLEVSEVRTFDRDDGSEGRVANLAIGDSTGRVRVTMWDDATEWTDSVETGDSVEVVDGYVRERDGDLEVHVNERSRVEVLDDDVEYVPDSTPIADLELGQTADLAGVVRSADPVRTFDRDDGSEGQVRNVRLQDDSGDLRVALWGEKADLDVAPGDRVAVTDVEIQDGWQDDLEASANWRSTVTVLADGATDAGEGRSGDGGSGDEDDARVGSFGDGSATDETPGDAGGDATGTGGGATTAEQTSFTGTVVQAGDPVVLDDGEQTLTVDTGADVRLGEEVTVVGHLRDGRVDADEVR
jgi:replication factor A1